jgi:hypothetical protein
VGTADGGTVVKVLCYNSEGRWFDYQSTTSSRADRLCGASCVVYIEGAVKVVSGLVECIA